MNRSALRACIFTVWILAGEALCACLIIRFAQRVSFRNRFVEGAVSAPLAAVTLVGYGWRVDISDPLSVRAIGNAFRRNRLSANATGATGEAVFRFRSGLVLRMQIELSLEKGVFYLVSHTTTMGLVSRRRWYCTRIARPLPQGLAGAFRLFLARPGGAVGGHRVGLGSGFRQAGTGGQLSAAPGRQ